MSSTVEIIILQLVNTLIQFMAKCETSNQNLIRKEVSNSKTDALQTMSNQCHAFQKSNGNAKQSRFFWNKMIKNSISKNQKTFQIFLPLKHFRLKADGVLNFLLLIGCVLMFLVQTDFLTCYSGCSLSTKTDNDFNWQNCYKLLHQNVKKRVVTTGQENRPHSCKNISAENNQKAMNLTQDCLSSFHL